MSSREREGDVGTTVEAGDDAAGQIIASLPGVFFLFRAADGVLLRWNRNLEQRTGHSADAIAHTRALNLIAPADRDSVSATIQRAIEQGSSLCEANLLGADGESIPYHFYGHRVRIDDQDCICGLGIDISPRRGAQAEAGRMRDRLIDAIESMPDGFAYYDADNRLQLCNSRYRELVGAGPEAIEADRSFVDVLRIGVNAGLYPEAEGRSEEWLQARMQRRCERPRDSFEQRLSTGQWLRVEEHPTRDDGRVSILVDITAYKDREARLRETEQRYRALFDNESDAIIISNVESGRIVDANRRAETMLGRERGRLLELTRQDLHPEDTRDQAEADYVTRWQRPNAFPFRQHLLRADGTIIPVEVSATVVTDNIHNRHLIQAAIRDVTPRERQERMTADRGRILESIASRAPLPEILTQIRGMIEHLGAAHVARVFLMQEDRLVTIDDGSALELDPALLRGGSDEVDADGRLPLPDAVARALGADDGDAGARVEPLWDRERQLVGALALVLPPHPPHLPELATTALREAARLAAIAIEQQHLADLLSWRAAHDELTALPNRTLLRDRLQQAIARARRYNHEASVMLLDLDDFKQINDTLGHSIGDKLLQAVAARLFACLRGEDTVARLGGDEFVLVLPATGPTDAALVADKIVANLTVPLEIEDHVLRTTPSIGISVHPLNGSTPQDLLRQADEAMYAAKRAGKGRYEFYTDTETADDGRER